jgi:phosphoglycerate dehydrogenase-like enzyme
MRVHVQTTQGDPDFAITPAQWREAAARAGEPAHDVSFGSSRADWDAAWATTELLVGGTAALRALGALAAPKLLAVFVNATGVDGLAPFGWLPPGAMLLNNRGTHGPKAGEYIAMTVLMLASRLPALASAQRAGQWRPVFSAPLAGRHATIVGTGDLGGAGARALRSLGVAVTGVRSVAAPHPDFSDVVGVADLDSVLARTEFLVLACPLTAATNNLLGRRRLALLPAGAGVVNLGRGALLDGEALCDALESGKISGAVLDVFDEEPLPAGHRMWRTENLVITPHVSCDDPVSYNLRSLTILFANLRALREGRPPPNRVDLSRGY